MAATQGQDAVSAHASLTKALGSGCLPSLDAPNQVLERRTARRLRLCGNGSTQSHPATLRRFTRVFLAMATAFLAIPASLVSSQGTAERPLLRGVVLDDASRAPVVGARDPAVGCDGSAVTGYDGLSPYVNGAPAPQIPAEFSMRCSRVAALTQRRVRSSCFGRAAENSV